MELKKNILFVNTAQKNKISALKISKDLGFDVSVVGTELPEWSKPYVCNYFHANTYNINETLSVLGEKYEKIPFHGVITFWDRDVVPVAAISNEFNLYGSPLDAAERARNKRRMRETLREAGIPHPKFYKITCWEELEKASLDMEYPIILKPVGASSSKGIFKVDDPKELKNTYKKMLSVVRPELDKMYTFYSDEFLVEEFMTGQEVSVEGIVSHGEIHIAGITEKWVDSFFAEYQHAFPARLSEDLENELIEITKASVKALGLNFCAFHAEVKITPTGCKIVEVNGRLGGDMINTHLVPLAKGIDIVRSNILAVMGEKVEFTTTKSRGACVRYLIAKNGGTVKEWRGIEEVRQIPGVVEFEIVKEPGSEVVMPPDKFYDTRLGYILAEGEDTTQAIEVVENALSKVTCIIE